MLNHVYSLYNNHWSFEWDLKLFPNLIPPWPNISQSILFENRWNIFPNSPMMMNPLLITQVSSYSSYYTQYFPLRYLD